MLKAQVLSSRHTPSGRPQPSASSIAAAIARRHHRLFINAGKAARGA